MISQTPNFISQTLGTLINKWIPESSLIKSLHLNTPVTIGDLAYLPLGEGPSLVRLTPASFVADL